MKLHIQHIRAVKALKTLLKSLHVCNIMPHLVLTHEVRVVLVVLQGVVQREPMSFLLVHCILLEEGKRHT